MDRVVLFSLERYGVKASSRWGLGEGAKPLTRPEVAEAVLAGREHDVRMSPLQVVAVFRELTKSKVDGESAEVQWNARCTEALRYLCEKVSEPEGVASAATGPECARLLKQLSICHRKLDPVEKEQVMLRLVARLNDAAIQRQLSAEGAVEVIGSTARSHFKDTALCRQMLRIALEDRHAGNPGPGTICEGRLRGEDVALLIHALPRHGIVWKGGAAEDDGVVAYLMEEAAKEAVVERLTAAQLAMVAAGTAALRVPADQAAAVYARVAAALKASPTLQRSLTEWQARLVASALERAGGDLLADPALAAALRAALRREAPAAKHDIVYGMAHSWIAPPAADAAATARFACRELRLVASSVEKCLDLLRQPEGADPSQPALSREMIDVRVPELHALLEAAVRGLPAMAPEELFFLAHSLAKLKKRSPALVRLLAERAGDGGYYYSLLAALHGQLVRDATLSRFVWSEHISGVMAAAAVLYSTRDRSVRAQGKEVVASVAKTLLKPETRHTRPIFHHTGALWAMGTVRCTHEDTALLLRSCVARCSDEVFDAQFVVPILWACARVRLMDNADVQRIAGKMTPDVIQGKITPKMLAIAVWAFAKLKLSKETIVLLMDECVAVDIAADAAPEVVSMLFYAVQICAVRHPALLDSLCDRLTGDEAVAAHFAKIEGRPQELLKVFLAMRYHNVKFLAWMRRLMLARHGEVGRA